jgi:pyridoxamine 5'-phosphate oxidase
VENDLAAMRKRYRSQPLRETDVPADPVTLFRRWLAEAVRRRLPEPNAMVLATTGAEGLPSTRTVLLKQVDADGFVFFTNLGSRKAAEITGNPAVALCFPWFAIERQVVVCGTAEPVPRDVAAAYWATRPRESQIGAWASRQSTVIGSRDELEARAAEVAERFPADLPLPDFWGGFRVAPQTVEFWQGGVARLHDRLRFTREGGGWRLERLAP